MSARVTPSALARRARLAPHRFARLMKRFFGLTPSQFIAKTRIAAASRLLCETNQSVADTASANTLLFIPELSAVQLLPFHLAMLLAITPPTTVKLPPM